ncbi:hypothetical protein HID58_055647 [Brassica napus]|uniref:Uncharacterized protein n=1 Tax=Brassica napus TaxID=3708 RepID=A0ABQ8ALD3_BRANA|nr:hypothetical protein HID58_055647 [Brassica napus]
MSGNDQQILKDQQFAEWVKNYTYVVENDSDYESTLVVRPNDEYISEDELDEACTDSDSESDSSS